MNFCVAPREIREINKRRGQNKLGGVSKNHEKNIRPPPPRLFWTWEYRELYIAFCPAFLPVGVFNPYYLLCVTWYWKAPYGELNRAFWPAFLSVGVFNSYYLLCVTWHWKASYGELSLESIFIFSYIEIYLFQYNQVTSWRITCIERQEANVWCPTLLLQQLLILTSTGKTLISDTSSFVNVNKLAWLTETFWGKHGTFTLSSYSLILVFTFHLLRIAILTF